MPISVQDRPSEAGPQQRRPQRRQLVPWPADAPKEPDRAKMRDAIEKLRGDVNRCKDRIEGIKAKLADRAVDPEKERLLQEKKDLLAKGAEIDNLVSEKIKTRNAMQDRLKAARVATRETEKQVRELNRELRDIKSVEQVDARIKELEFRQETGGCGGLKGERRVMAEIQQLKAQRAKAASLDDKLGEIVAKQRDVEDVGDHRALQAEIDVLRDQRTAIREQIDGKQAEIAARNDRDRMQALRDEKDALHKKIGEYFQQMDGIRSKFDEDKAKYDEYRVEHKKKEDEAWEKLRREQAEERARKEEERKEREIQIAAVKRLNPHEEEIALCENLISYLQKLVQSHDTEHRRQVERQHFDAVAVAQAKGMTVVGKSGSKGGDDDWLFGDSKKKKAAKPKGPAAPAAEKPKQEAASKQLKHQYTRFDAFDKVGVKIPMRSDEVKGAIEELRKKQEHWKSFIKSEKEALEEEKAEQQKRLEQEAADKAAAAAEGAKDGSPAASPKAASPKSGQSASPKASPKAQSPKSEPEEADD